MNKLTVTISELRSTASRISTQNNAFRDAADQLRRATGILSDSWTGVAHDSFVATMEQRFAWYAQMSLLVDEYIQMLANASDSYAETDSAAAALIRRS